MIATNKGKSFAERMVEMWSPLSWSEDSGGLEVDSDRLIRFGGDHVKIYFLVAAALMSGSVFMLSTELGTYVTTQVFTGACTTIAVGLAFAGFKLRRLLSRIR